MGSEILEGTGKLRSNGTPPLEFDVTYRFDITMSVVTHVGMAGMASGRRKSQGVITSVTNEFIPGGHYQLETENGETLRVNNLGINHWHIIGGV